MERDELKGRAALVTGASRNIGRAIAVALAQRGADIVVHVAQDKAAGMDTAATVADHYGRFLPQDKAALAAQVLNRVWEDAEGS